MCRNLYLETLWEPVQCHLGNLETLHLGTLSWKRWKLWQPWEACRTLTWEPPVLGNLDLVTLETFTWQHLLGNLVGTFTLEPWEPLLWNLGNLHLETFTWEPFGPCRNLYLATFTWELWQPLLGNLYSGTLATFTWEPLLGNVVGTCAM